MSAFIRPCRCDTSHLCRPEEVAGIGADAAAVEEAEEEEPSWELPDELQEFRGDADDRKGMLAFRQKQQSARQVKALDYSPCL